LTNYPNLNFDVGLDIPFSLKPHPFLPFLTATFVGLFSFGSLAGQPLSSSLQLNPKKLTGFYFAMPSSDFDFFGAEAPNQGAIRSTMSEFAENSEGLQLVFISNDSNVAKFNELKSSSLSKNAHLYKGFFGIGSQTQIGKALVQNFKVSVLPTLLICNNSDRILDANGLSSLKSKSDPYAYWKSLDTTINPTAISKPAPLASKPASNNKLGFDAEIEKLEKRRLQIISSINDLLYGFSVSIKNETVDDANALNTLRVGGNKWIAYSETLFDFAGDKVRDLDVTIDGTSTLSVSVRKLVMPKLDLQRKTLIDYRDRKLRIISSKREAFNKMVDQCNELLQTIEFLGRDEAVVLIDKVLADFQKLHFSSPKK
jgi:hypothetical protein